MIEQNQTNEPIEPSETNAPSHPIAPTPTTEPNEPSAPNGHTDRPPLPDHLSSDPRSPHHVPAVFQHDVGIRFNGKERFDVDEYCTGEGWVKVPAGKTVDRKGKPVLIKLKGKVEAFYK